MPEIIIGVDAGGSHTVAASARGDEIVRTATGDAANPQLYGIERSVQAIAQTVLAALDGAQASALAVGVAGAGREATRVALLEALSTRFPQTRVTVTDDAHIALRGAVPNGNGMLLIAGTGSIAYAELEGKRYRAGGYGYAIGDEGSGYAIGAAALRHLLRVYERRLPQDALCVATAEYLNVANAHDVLATIYESEAPIASVAACAHIVIDQASTGERTATKITQTAALALFDLIKPLVTLSEPRVTLSEPRVTLSEVEGLPLPLVFAGGLLQTNSLLTYLLETRIANELPHLRIVKGSEPYRGALAAARALLA